MALVHFAQSPRAASTVEQALFIALIIGAALAAVEGLGVASRSVFSKAARQMHAGGAADAEARALQATASAPNASRVGGGEQTGGFLLPSRFLLLLFACPFGAACWYLLYRETRKKRGETAAEASTPRPAVEEESVFTKRHDLLRAFSGDVGMLFTSRMRIRQVMTRELHWVLPGATIAEVRELMSQRKIRHVLVCDKHERLLGVISDRDVHSPAARVAKDVMASDPASAEPDGLVNQSVTLMLQKHISCLPVVEAGRVVGVVTTTDMLLALQCTLHALQRAGAEAVANLPPETVPGFMLAALQQVAEVQPAESA